MKHVKGDMEDLFRRASERYPLRMAHADWERLAADLDNDPAAASDTEAVDRRRRRGIFWWMLLLPLGGLGYLTWQTVTHSGARPVAPATQVVGAAKSGGMQDGGTAAQGAGAGMQGGAAVARSGDAVTHGGTAVAHGAAVVVHDHAAVAHGAAAVARGGAAAGQAGETAMQTDGMAATQVSEANAGTKGVDAGARGVDAGARGVRDRAKSNGATSTDMVTPGEETGGATANTMGNMTANATGNQDRQLYLSALDLRTVQTGGNFNLTVDVKAPAKTADNVGSRPKKATANTKTNHGYIGIMGAPDFSTVKLQTMKGVGATFGVLLGYSFNDRLAVESGIYLDRKRYYSQGEYFNEKNVNTYPNTYLLNVDGTCYMWEIPLNIRYNFSKNERMKWFVTAGLSTYLMTKENYTYQWQYTWGGSVNNGKWAFKKPSQYWFSMVNISGGFEQRIGKIGNLRIEPYLRLPLSGIGTGRLPIMSAGLNIGITRQLW